MPRSASSQPEVLYWNTARPLAEDEIPGIVAGYAGSAERLKRAGFSGVELHGAHGYLIAQFLSPACNDRMDGYGGSFEGRTRFMREVMAAVRAACRGGFYRRHQAAGGRACAGRHRTPTRREAYRRHRRGRRRARLSLLQPRRVRARVRYPSARHALPAPAVPASPHAAPRGRRRAPGDRPRQDRIGGGGRGSARRGRLRHGRLQPPADLGRRLAPQDSGRPGRATFAPALIATIGWGEISRRQTHPLLPEPRAGEHRGVRLAAAAGR